MAPMQTVAVIPARYASTRFPGKPLALIRNRPMVWWVWHRVRKALRVQRVVVATDDERIVRAVEAFGGEARLTSARHRTGTERVAEVARSIRGDLFLNVQGDEPAIHPGTVDAVVDGLARDRGAGIATAAVALKDARDFEDPNQVKVVLDRKGRALYFSRAPIPALREPGGRRAPRWKHLGIYAYRREVLLAFPRWSPTPLERSEVLEQLRALENGVVVRVVRVDHDSIGVDRPGDIPRVERLLARA